MLKLVMLNSLVLTVEIREKKKPTVLDVGFFIALTDNGFGFVISLGSHTVNDILGVDQGFALR